MKIVNKEIKKDFEVGDIVTIGSHTYLVVENAGEYFLQNIEGYSIYCCSKSSLEELRDYVVHMGDKVRIYSQSKYGIELIPLSEGEWNV